MEDEPSTSTKTSKYSRHQSKIFNDPIWGPIELNPVCVKIIDTPEFQRLRFIKQLGGCSFVYPGAVHTRFEHSIGTSYLAGCLVRNLKKKLKKHNPEYNIKIKDKDILCVEIAGLCHDLGHGAFSHLFDQLFIPRIRRDSDWTHEKASVDMMFRIFENNKDLTEIADKEDLKLGPKSNDRNFIEGLIRGKKSAGETGREEKLDFLYEIVANEKNKIDVDKWDYFSRDCHMLGMKHNFQVMRSIMLARVIKHKHSEDDNKYQYHISFPLSEYMNIFDMYHARYTLHRRAYQHPVNKAVELMITDALCKANDKLVYREKTLAETIDDMELYTQVTDGVIDRIRFEEVRDDKDSKFMEAKKIIDRIFKRELYKCGMERRVERTEILKEVPNEAIDKEIKKYQDKWKIHLEPIVFNYGAGIQNPMKNVTFYSGSVEAEPDDEKPPMLPKDFEETYLRMYLKEPDEDGNKAVKELVSKSTRNHRGGRTKEKIQKIYLPNPSNNSIKEKKTTFVEIFTCLLYKVTLG
ncbi:deoxynucleoside triphosphate triphosphohydrolase SAMHD1-like isoform X1 [Saccostrea cucullata]|uniref:deoxynucleoside triphosphate triphosphohydrolase SAMHD1-like isoform X1 n=1 Tax=Saccostrea cuccullata TaxID=36930 RepID=UPI002ED2ADA7